MALIRILLVIFIIYYLGRLVMRFILPTLFNDYMDDKMKEFARQQQKQRMREQEQSRKREGEVNIDYSPKGDNRRKPSRGEYVDYEEIRD